MPIKQPKPTKVTLKLDPKNLEFKSNYYKLWRKRGKRGGHEEPGRRMNAEMRWEMGMRKWIEVNERVEGLVFHQEEAIEIWKLSPTTHYKNYYSFGYLYETPCPLLTPRLCLWLWQSMVSLVCGLPYIGPTLSPAQPISA